MNYSDALNQIIKLQSLGIVPGLSRILSLLNALDNPQSKIKVIHIAGTNGKGSVAKMINDALIGSGKSVGLFTSPFVVDYKEQIQLNNNFISEKDFCFQFEKILPFALKFKTTEFETLTALMFNYFFEKGVDFAVVECGMGGKNDSTNVVENPVLCVLTSIALDHQNFLGNSIEEIAKEKSGIIKQGSNVILYPNSCQSIIEEKSIKMGANLFLVNNYGEFSRNNFETAKLALAVLGVNSKIQYPSLPARQEIFDKYIIDGAHNFDGAIALKQMLNSKYKNKKITAVVGLMKDKNYFDFCKTICPLCELVITTTPSNPRSITSTELSLVAKKFCKNVLSVNDPHLALQEAQKSNSDLILICGSFFLARDIRKDII